jgi:class 3 adenylate cyclase
MDTAAGSTPTAIDHYTLAFSDADVERRYRADHHDRAARSARWAMASGAPGYVLLYLILDDTEARRVVFAMIVIVMAGIPLAWTNLFVRHYERITLGAMAALTGLSVVLVLTLPPASAVLIAIAMITLNYMWLFLFLRPRFPWALALGVCYLVAVVPTGASIWDRFGAGEPPVGMADVLAGGRGGAALVFAYGGFLLVLTASIAYRLERGDRVDFVLREELALAHHRSEQLLTNILPVPVAERLKNGESPIADECPDVTVVFADIADFTAMSSSMHPSDLVALLDDVFTRFDDLAVRHGLEKIKTVGDAYMAVAGAPEPKDDHAHAAAAMALDMVDTLADVDRADGTPLRVRVGIASGPAVAGVIGTSKFIYDLWGDTVNTASRMESQGLVGRVQVSESTRHLLGGDFEVEERGAVLIKGKGSLRTWLLAERTSR